MRHCWAIGTLLLAGVLMGNACKSMCVSKELCLHMEPIFDYRSKKCGRNQICCAVLRENFIGVEKPGNPILIEPNGPTDNEPRLPSTTRGPARNGPDITSRIDFNVGQQDSIDVKPPKQVQNRPNDNTAKNPFQDTQNPVRGTSIPIGPPTTNVGNLQPLSMRQCGMSNINGLQNLAGVTSDQARPAQYPWVVALFYEGEYWAGGSLIRPNVVLTVAHRLVMVHNNLLVRAGDWDLQSDLESFVFQQREVERVVTHDEFVFETGANNLALVFLKSPFKLDEHIRTICLPSPNKLFKGRRCTVAGWGKRTFEDKESSSILKKIEVPMVDRTVCENQLKSSRLGVSYQLPENVICAGGEIGRDACTRDGGSALFCSVGEENSGIYEQAGIVSWGIGCGQHNIPGTYTEVSKFIDWINQKLVPFDYRHA